MDRHRQARQPAPCLRLLTSNYGLLDEDNSGVVCLSQHGTELLKSPGGKVEFALDDAKCLLEIFALVEDSGPANFGGFVQGWNEVFELNAEIFVEFEKSMDQPNEITK